MNVSSDWLCTARRLHLVEEPPRSTGRQMCKLHGYSATRPFRLLTVAAAFHPISLIFVASQSNLLTGVILLTISENILTGVCTYQVCLRRTCHQPMRSSNLATVDFSGYKR